ncbi:MAG: fibro-slime domain-containing protein, partial [Firmicutes bacterium]|nr:fibro-slime domain-containing protein [Bacillota bacterium]
MSVNRSAQIAEFVQKFRKKLSEKQKRSVFAVLVCACLIMPYCINAIQARELDNTGLCKHHPIHDETCGYVEAQEGQPCSHVHDESCGYQAACEEVPCDKGCVVSHNDECSYKEAAEEIPCNMDCSVVHAPECGYQEASDEIACDMNCSVEHTFDCGYKEATEEIPCDMDCSVVHVPDCGYKEATEEIPCNMDCVDIDDDGVVDHDKNCAYTPAEDEMPCDGSCEIVHDENCAYTPAAEEVPCDGNCEIVHDENCAYAPEAEEVPCDGNCEIVHDENCAYAPAAEEVPCDSNCNVAHDEGCSYMPAVEEVPCNHTHDESCGYKAPIEGSPCSFKCEECFGKDIPAEEQKTVLVQSWNWIDDQEMLVWDENEQMWSLSLIGASEENTVTKEILVDLLPAQIDALLSDDNEKTLEVLWDLSGFPDGEIYDGSYTVAAFLPEGYDMDKSVPKLYVLVELGGAKIYDTLDESQLQDHIVTGIDPAETSVNLFDYWVKTEMPSYATRGDILDKEVTLHARADGSATRFSGPEQWNMGINENHLLIFGDGVVHAGLWNKGAGENTDYGKKYAGMEDIVKPVLENGYPVINTENAAKQLIDDQSERDWELIKDWKLSTEQNEWNGIAYDDLNTDVQNLSKTVIENWENATGESINGGTESLDYLFDPEIENEYKKTYTNVKGLFQLDDEGYYYYNMRENFAEFDKNDQFILYDAPATLRSDGTNSVGNFFPFNEGTEVFTDIKDGKLESSVACFGNTMNHHMGMTIEVEFRQPVEGKVNVGSKGSQPMTFKFAGDDDVWVFIDDVLVLDLGGVHSELYGTIDFETGDIYVGQAFGAAGNDGIPEDPSGDKMVTHTTIKEMFEKAGKADEFNWRNETFASNTDHTLNMFYLERGNYDSSLAIRFNLQPRLHQQVKKVDQNGKPIEGVEFELYDAEEVGAGTDNAIVCTNVKGTTASKAIYVAEVPGGKCLSAIKTDEGGTAYFVDNAATDEAGEQIPFNFADRYNLDSGEGIYYILKEKNAPSGYRTLPIDIVLEYNPETAMLSVANRWTTGAYASFVSIISGNSNITYGHYNPDSGNVESDFNKPVSAKVQETGLVVAMPMLKQKNGAWDPLYGNNMDGFCAVEYDHISDDKEVDNWREAALKAALYQCAEAARAVDDESFTADWHLVWNNDEKHLEGELSDLPGNAARYRLNNSENADMRMEYAIITPEALAAVLGHVPLDQHGMYASLGECVNRLVDAGSSIDEAVAEIAEGIMNVTDNSTGSGHGFSFLNVDQFNRNFRSLLYIPNEQRELRVIKVDQDGRSVNGTEFGLYYDEDCTQQVVSGKTANVDGQDGTLIFAPYDSDEAGHAKMEWANSANTHYYLKEIKAPEGYDMNENVVPIVVGIYSIYADAGTAENGITVMAGVGKLTQTMNKYASDGDVNITLRDITAYSQVQNSGEFKLTGWKDMELSDTNGQVMRSMNFHYGKNAFVDYGLHDKDGGKNFRPFFVTNNGFIRTRVQQNSSALGTEMYDPISDTSWDDLENTDITSLFSLLNIVVVTDQTDPDTQTGQLAISKKLTGENIENSDYTKNFEFSVTLTDSDGTPLLGEYYFYGTDKSGYVRSGDKIYLHHDESITILGLPVGAKYIVEETPENNWYVSPSSGTISGEIENDVTEMAEFFNSKQKFPEVGSLTVSKTVTGNGGDKEKLFTFKVSLSDNTINGTYGDMTFYDGQSNVLLKHGETKTAHNLPAGIKYSVVEEEANKDGYTTSSKGEEGTIKANGNEKAEFTNHKEAEKPPVPVGELTILKNVTGNKGDKEKQFHFTVTLKDKEGNELTGSYDYSGSKEGTLKSGESVALKDGESVTIHNIPE